MHETRLRIDRGSRLAAMLVAASIAVGCSSSQQDESYEASELELTQQWTFCANQGERCEFTGTHQVRYQQNSRSVVRTFTDGVLCTGSAFGTRRNSGSCSYDVSQPMAGAGASMPPSMAAGGTPSSMAAGSGTDHSMHAAAGSGAMAMGPYIDTNAIPSGDTGSSKVQIEATSEQPAGSDGTGAFRNECTFSHMSFNDPIVFPGQPGKSHLHAYFGNTAIDAQSTPESVRNSGNSTCRGGIANRTGYWVPAVIDAAGKPVKPKALEVYYKSGYNGIKASAIKPFPSGLRMIAGSAKSTAAQSVAYWGCAEKYVGHLGSIPNICSAGDTVKMTVEFPQCWDGKNLDSDDHKSHMAYPQGGGCPATHPVPIPAISFNILYPVPSNGTAGWRLASDMYDASMPAGYSAHADWFDGWDPAVAKTFVEHCINPALDCHSHLLGDGRRIF